MFKPTHSTYTVQYMQNYKYFTHMDKGEDMSKASGKCLYCHNPEANPDIVNQCTMYEYTRTMYCTNAVSLST